MSAHRPRCKKCGRHCKSRAAAEKCCAKKVKMPFVARPGDRTEITYRVTEKEDGEIIKAELLEISLIPGHESERSA